MSRGGFTVAWEHYNSTMCAGLQEMQQRAEFVDMTIAADGHLVRVHQLVMGLASPYLKDLIRSAPNPHPILFLNNVSHKVLCCILEYMYTGEVVVPADDLKNFITTGKALHVRGLQEMVFQESTRAMATTAASPEAMEAANTLENISTGHTSQLKHDTSFPQDSSVISKYTQNNVHTPTFSRSAMSKRSAVSINMPELTLRSPKLQKLSSTIESIADPSRESDNRDDGDQDDLHDDDGADNEDDSYPVITKHDYADPSLLKKTNLLYTMSNMGGIQLILNRFIYCLRNTYKDGRRRWACVEYFSPKRCIASVVTHNNIVLSRKSLHSHPFHDKKIMSKVNNKMVYSSIENMPEKSKKKEDDKSVD